MNKERKVDTNRPIGIFDSGVGGLTVLKKLVNALPDENYIYFGDTARVPYGEKSTEQLLQFSREILDWFRFQNVKIALMACNTSSAVTLSTVASEYDFPVLGLIQPASKYVAGLTEQKIGLIATSATVRSKAYPKAIFEMNPQKKVVEMACPGLVEIVESGNIQTEESKALVKSYIQPLLENSAEKIILGCTHYPYLSEVINQITGKNDLLIDPADFLVEQTNSLLTSLNLVSENKAGSRKYYVSGNADKFAEVGSRFIDDCKLVETVDITKAVV